MGKAQHQKNIAIDKGQYKKLMSMMSSVINQSPRTKNHPMLKNLFSLMDNLSEGDDISESVSKSFKDFQEKLKPEELDMLNSLFSGLSTDTQNYKKEIDFLKEQTNKYQARYIEEKGKVLDKDREISQLKGQIEIYKRIIDFDLKSDF